MLIKLVILDSNAHYAERLIQHCYDKYHGMLEVRYFSDKDRLAAALEGGQPHVLLAHPNLGLSPDDVDKLTAFAYLSDSTDCASINGVRALCRYQKIETLYQEILGLYAEVAELPTKGMGGLSGNSRRIAFTAAAGGSGISTAAIAFATYCAKSGRRVLYFNLEPLGNVEQHLQGPGTETLASLIYALKSKKSNLGLRVKSALRRDGRGISFIASPQNPLDGLELTAEDYENLLGEIDALDQFDYVVLDVAFSFQGVGYAALTNADLIVLLSSGLCAEDCKKAQMLEGLKILSGDSVTQKMVQIRNFSEGAWEDTAGPRVVGRIPRYTNATHPRVIEAVSELEFWESLCKGR